VRAAGVVLVVLAAVLAGCGAETSAREGAGLSGAELEWVADYAAWTAGFDERLRREQEARAGALAGGAGLEKYRQAAASLVGCAEDVAGELDSPPTARLDPTLDALHDMCRAIAPAVRRLAAAPSAASLVDALHTVEQGVLRREEIDAALETLLLARGTLPELTGDVTASRIEPALTAAAGRVAAGRSIHVRCWAAADWRQVLREEEALTNGYLAVDTTGAFAVPRTSTLHLQQEQCEPLARLATDGLAPGEGVDRSELSYAVGVLSHEIQHIAGRGTEAETECVALQHHAEVARELGASESYALSLASTYLIEHYPPDDEEYRSEECRPGGALDLAPETPAWPTG